MATSPDYKRGYSKGYHAAKCACVKQRSHLGTTIAELLERAKRAEAGLGLGECAGCLHWQREEHCYWGWCLLTEDVVTLDWPWRGEPHQKISTKENFGCIRFADKETP